jgi:hypothetical protein
MFVPGKERVLPAPKSDMGFSTMERYKGNFLKANLGWMPVSVGFLWVRFYVSLCKAGWVFIIILLQNCETFSLPAGWNHAMWICIA